MVGHAPGGGRRGFTLVELLTVLGLLALLAALFLPVVGRLRGTAAAAGCLSNLKQMGTAWMMALSEDHGRLPQYSLYMPAVSPEAEWRGYWTGTMDRSKVAASTLCPSAPGPVPSGTTRGYGTAEYAWSGEYAPVGTIHWNKATFRQSSYGYNGWLTEAGGFGRGGRAMYLSDVQNVGNVPVFIDCAYAETKPDNRAATYPVDPPPSLGGTHAGPGKPDHWMFVFARHGRGVNVYRADGSATWVRLEELYLLNWKDGWEPYRLELPRH